MKRLLGLCGLVMMIALVVTAFAQEGAGDVVYVVERGDTLETIGQRLDVSVLALLLANDITRATILFPDDELLIPADAPPYGFAPAIVIAGGSTSGSRYVVQSGDVLDLIAAYFDIDLACLVERNEIDNPNLILPGLAIALPTDCPEYRGLSSVLPDQIRGLNLRAVGIGDGLTLPTRRPTVTPSNTPSPIPTNTPVPPTATFTPSNTPTLIPTNVPPAQEPTVTPTAVG